MSRLTRDGTAEPVSRDQILTHARGQGNIIFPVQLTTSRIGNLTRLIYTLLYVMTIHTYIPYNMTRMTGLDCAVMCYLINTHTHSNQNKQDATSLTIAFPRKTHRKLTLLQVTPQKLTQLSADSRSTSQLRRTHSRSVSPSTINNHTIFLLHSTKP